MAPDSPTIAELARALEAGDTSSIAATEHCLARIRTEDPSINAFITVFESEALVQARDADHERANGRRRGPLHGVPLSVKDLLDVKGAPTTAASAVRRGHLAQADAVVVERLRREGAVIVGKTNLHEFALGTTNEDSAYGPVHHPLDPTRSPGGSSGGAAAAVLMGMCCASVGSDTGGSIRIPSAACGLVGLKPRFGDVSTDGVVPVSTTLDHIGPICRTVEDAAILYHAICDRPGEGGSVSGTDLGRPRLGVVGGYLMARLDPDVRRRFDEACARLESAGVHLEHTTVPHASEVPGIYVHIVLSEAAAFHAPALERRPHDYTPAVRLRLEMGRTILAEDYVRALRGRDVLMREVDTALAGRDGLILPSLAVPATPLGVDTVMVDGIPEQVRSITLRQTQLFNLTGHPAISIPCGTTGDGLPVGVQVVGRTTPALLDLARRLEPLLTA